MTGIGIRRMMSDVTRLASENLQNVYVVGATNVGKVSWNSFYRQRWFYFFTYH